MKAFSAGNILMMVSLVSALSLAGCATSRSGGGMAETAEVQSVNGNVDVRLPGNESWTPAYVGQQFSAGAVVRTGENGTADLRLALDGPMMRVLPASRVELVRMTRYSDGRTHTVVHLRAGHAYVDDRSVKPGSNVEIRTPRGVVTVPPR